MNCPHGFRLPIWGQPSNPRPCLRVCDRGHVCGVFMLWLEGLAIALGHRELEPGPRGLTHRLPMYWAGDTYIGGGQKGYS